MKLFFVNGLRAGEELEFAIPEITVGRELDNVVIIPVEGVSRYHGKLKLQSNGKWIVEDTGSTNGIKCNRVKIQGPQELQEGDLIEFGNQMVRVTGLISAAAPVVFSALEEDPEPIPLKPQSPAVPEEIKITPPTAQDELKITPPGQQGGLKIAPPQHQKPVRIDLEDNAAPVKIAPTRDGNAHKIDLPPSGSSSRELSEALKNGKLNLFGNTQGEKKNSHGLSDTPGKPKKKPVISNLLFYTLIICLAAVGIAAFYKMNLSQQPAAKQQDSSVSDSLNAKRFMLFYEKQIITPDNVFYFVLHIENGMASFQIDDLKSSRYFTRDNIPFTVDAYEKFHADLEHENFFKADSPAEAMDSEGKRDHRRMVVCDQGRLHEITVRNNMPPSAFERLEMTINLFAENHALRTVSMTPDELREQAEMAFNKAEDLFQNRHSRASNLREAIHRYRLAVEYLDAFRPRPKLWDMARKRLDAAEKIRQDRLAALRSERIRLGQLKEFAAVLPVLEEIMALSDPDSPQFSDARQMRIKIDSYLHNQGARRK